MRERNGIKIEVVGCGEKHLLREKKMETKKCNNNNMQTDMQNVITCHPLTDSQVIIQQNRSDLGIKRDSARWTVKLHVGNCILHPAQ